MSFRIPFKGGGGESIFYRSIKMHIELKILSEIIYMAYYDLYILALFQASINIFPVCGKGINIWSIPSCLCLHSRGMYIAVVNVARV